MATARRHYFAHHAHRSVGLSAFPEALRQLGLATRRENAPDCCTLRVLFVSAPQDEPSEEAIWGLKQYLEDESACECGRAFCSLVNLPATELECGDCLVVLLSARDEMAAWQGAVDSVCRRGNGVVAIVLDAETSPGWSQTNVAPGAEEHPLLPPGPVSIAVADQLPNLAVPEDAQVVLTTTLGPVAWSAKRGTGSLFCMWLGHAAGLGQTDFRRLLRGALRWAVGRD